MGLTEIPCRIRKASLAIWLLALFLVLMPVVKAATNTGLPTISATTASQTSSSSEADTSASSTSSNTGGADSSSSTATTTSGFPGLSGAPTLAGVGIPTLVVPYTAPAPFMQKSSLPEGTVFIAVGAVLAVLGFAVLAWRATVAWSINRSVKRAALASIMASETKNPGGWTSNPFRPPGGFYHQTAGGSNLSLGDTNNKTQARGAPFRNAVASTGSNLFFSPTATNNSLPTANIPLTGISNPGARGSVYLPAGFYAAPGQATSKRSSLPPPGSDQAPYTYDSAPQSPRRSSVLQRPMSYQFANTSPNQRGSMLNHGAQRTMSPAPLLGALHSQPSNGSLTVGVGQRDDDDAPHEVRAPSAYLEDLFGSTGHGHYER